VLHPTAYASIQVCSHRRLLRVSGVNTPGPQGHGTAGAPVALLVATATACWTLRQALPLTLSAALTQPADLAAAPALPVVSVAHQVESCAPQMAVLMEHACRPTRLSSQRMGSRGAAAPLRKGVVVCWAASVAQPQQPYPAEGRQLSPAAPPAAVSSARRAAALRRAASPAAAIGNSSLPSQCPSSKSCRRARTAHG
jgi:hypothetical protein